MQQEVSSAVHLLEDHPKLRRVMLAGHHARLHTEEAVRELLAHTAALRSEHPRQAGEWAMLAWQAATHLRTAAAPGLQAISLAEEGNAGRLLGQWSRAEMRFARALELVEGSPPGLAAMEVHLLLASLAIQREQWARALASLEVAQPVADGLADSGARTRVLFKRAFVERGLKRYREAVAADLAAWRIAGPERPVEQLRALHNVTVTYADGGWPEAAREIQAGIAPWYNEAPHHLQAEGLWLRGRIACGLGSWDEGAEHLHAARCMLETRGYYWELAEILCDEAEAYLRIGRLTEVLELAPVAEAAHRAIGLEHRARRAASLLRAAAGGRALLALTTLRRHLREQRAGRRLA